MQIFTKLKGLNIRGASHHFLLPVLAILVVAGIGGFIMQRGSSAASVCKNATYSRGSRSECVRYAQYMLKTASQDAVFGQRTQEALKRQTGQSSLNKAAWNKLCAKDYGTTINKQRNAACIGGKYTTKIGNPTIGYKVCTKYKYTSPRHGYSAPYYPLSKPKISCASGKWRVYSGVGSQAKAKQAADRIKNSDARYKVFQSDKKLWNLANPNNKTAAPASPQRIKCSVGVPCAV